MSTHRCRGKTSWPELVGKNGQTAAATIERENRNVHAIIHKEGDPTTMDFRCDRVWVVVNDHGIVTSIPRTF
ncbi:Proteinase inhibitor [Linum grandiflorum]